MYIAGMGVVSALGNGVAATIEALESPRQTLRPVVPFAIAAPPPLKVGMAVIEQADASVPRTHLLARMAADQALALSGRPPDAIVVGSTTGGILTTEGLLEMKVADPSAYAFHGLGSLADDLARRCGCTGPVLTVSTACSSGAVAIKLALEILRGGRFKRVLVGAADSLSRLTYFGFKSLQLVDPEGARPLDLDRRGMSVAEGAAMLLLTSEQPEHPAIYILGAGLSCDAYHATSPQPEGEGARAAMLAALDDAGLSTADIDYVNLHGTGTRDNDLAEARAVLALFGDRLPLLSSTKGSTGHTLAAAGAIEAVIAAGAIEFGIGPGNAGFSTPDPDLQVTPLIQPLKTPLTTVMSNSLGFGGNNAAVIIGRSKPASTARVETASGHLAVVGTACITGAGHLAATLEAFRSGRACGGCLDDAAVTEGLPPRVIRRLKRLPKLALALALNACGPSVRPTAVSLGTGWGALSETCDFLNRLAETGQAYPSPTDFVGSVHNAPAGQIAMQLGAKGANVTTSGGDCSFEQALWSAQLLTQHCTDSILVLGTDEYHPRLSPLFDLSVCGAAAADGGGALLLQHSPAPGVAVALVDYRSGADPDAVRALIERLGGARALRDTCGAILSGCPAAQRVSAQRQLAEFLAATRFTGPLIDYRRWIGEFAGASAVAAVMGVEMVRQGAVGAVHAGRGEPALNGKSVLLLGWGAYLTAVRIFLT
jgi:3-oxoacyl-(acyl-carrier-protein) synthase